MDAYYAAANLLTTPTASDIVVSGGSIEITGLKPVRKADIVSIFPLVARAETVQVMTIGGTTDPTITASTTYIIQIGNTGNRIEGEQGQLKKYKYTTPATLSGTAATDRQNVYDALTTRINADGDNNVVANAGTGGTSMTITDDAGYYNIETGRLGASVVKLLLDSAGLGFVDATHREETTSAVYAFGQGADLLAAQGVLEATTGNIASGFYDFDWTTDAVSGQTYTGFFITSIIATNANTSKDAAIADVQSWRKAKQLVFADDAAVGYAAFLKEFEKAMYEVYSSDPSAIVEFFDTQMSFTAATGLGDPGTTGAGFIFTQDNSFTFTQIGTNTIVAPTIVATGLELDQDLTDTEGNEIVSSLLANTPKSFIVGDSEFSIRAELTVADVTDGAYLVGFRLLEAHQADFNDYNDLAALGTLAASSSAIEAHGILNNAATFTVDPSVALVDATTVALEIRVDGDGVVTALIDDVAVTIESASGVAMVFDSGDELIPFVRGVNVGGGTPDAVLSKLAVIPAVIDRTI